MLTMDDPVVLVHGWGGSFAETWQRIPRNLGAIAGRILFRALENAGLQMSLAPHRGVAVTARDEALYRAAGEAVYVAARLTQAAKPGVILVSAATAAIRTRPATH